MTTNDKPAPPKPVTNAELKKRVEAIESRLSVGQLVNIRVLEEPTERWMRCLFLGMSPDHPDYVVVYNSNFGVKEYHAEKAVRL